MNARIEKEIKGVMEQYENDSSEVLPDWLGAIAGGFAGLVIIGLSLTSEAVTEAIADYGTGMKNFISILFIVFLGAIGFVTFRVMKEYKKNAARNNALENLYSIQKIIDDHSGLYSEELSLLKKFVDLLIAKRNENK